MKEKELMITVLRILLQKGIINQEIFESSIKKINERTITDSVTKFN